MSISAKTGEGLDRLLAAIGERLDTGAKRVTIHLPYDKGGLVDRLYQEAKVETGGLRRDHRRGGRLHPQDHRTAGPPGGGLAAP